MPFSASPMFPGDLYDTMDRIGATTPSRWQASSLRQESPQWQQVLELGWQGVVVDEAAGGVGATLADFASIAEAAGRHAVTLPLIARCVVAPTLLLRGRHIATRSLLEQISAGIASVCPVIETTGTDEVRATQVGEGHFQLQGIVRGAVLTEPASHFVFPATAGNDSTPLLVILDADRVTQNICYFDGIDGQRTGDITLDGMIVEADQVLLQGEAATAAIQNAMLTGAVMTCVQTVGALGAMIEQTIEYLSTRNQFGVALSTFQALRHRTVDMYVAYEGARGLVKQIAEDWSTNPSSSSSQDRDAALTKLYLATVGRMVAEAAIQLHGGMGMTVEMPAARLAMHTLMCNLQYGDRLHYLDSLSMQMMLAVRAPFLTA
jgi:alkylation response protein AidB-like acyl-CoA dehydrogenase